MKRSPYYFIIAASLSGAVMLVFLTAGLFKLMDLADFSSSLRSWTLLPSTLLPLVAIVVPMAELALGAAWMMGLQRPRVEWLGVGFLMCATLAYAIHVAIGEPPNCRCFGALEHFALVQLGAKHLIIRNTLLIALLLAGMTRRLKPLRAAESPA